MKTVMNTLSLGALIALSLAMTACNKGVSRETQAIVMSVAGEVSVTHAQSGRMEPVQVRSRLAVGDSIKSTGEGRLALQIIPGILSGVNENSEWTIEELQVAKDGNAMTNAMLLRKARLRLVRGVMDAVVQKKDPAGATLTVDTSFGIVDGPGESVFRITVSDRSARVVCIRGTIRVQRVGRAPTLLEAGLYCDWGGDSEAAKPVEEDGEVQSDVLASLERMQELLVLQNQEILRPVPWRQFVTKKP